MTEYPKILLLLILLSGLIYSENLGIEKSAKLIEPAVIEVNLVTKTTLTIQKEFLPDFKELIGRSYVYSGNKKLDGVLVNPDGYIIINSNIISNETIVNDTIDFDATAIMEDTGRIGHLRGYGMEINNNELISYKNYFYSQFNGSGGFSRAVSSAYANNIISISIQNKSITVKLSNDSEPIDAKLIYTNDKFALLKIEKTNTPTVELKNISLQNGDQIFVVTKNKTEPGLIEITDSGQKMLKHTNEDEKKADVITDYKGTPVAFDLGNGIITKEDLEEALKKSNVTEESSLTNAQFREALESYTNGDYTSAKEKLKKVLELYPEHEQAKEYLEEIDTKTAGFNEWGEKINEELGKTPNEFKFVGAVVLVLALSIYVLNKLKNKKQKRGRDQN